MSRTTKWVIALCWVTIIFDGYDLIVYGAVVPSLLEYEPWSLSPEQAGHIGSYALFGMLIGALIAGTITDLVGRRKIILFCIAWFSLAMGLCAIAPTPELFGLFRFIAGLGLGGVVPTASAITIEYAPPERRKFLYALMFSRLLGRRHPGRRAGDPDRPRVRLPSDVLHRHGTARARPAAGLEVPARSRSRSWSRAAATRRRRRSRAATTSSCRRRTRRARGGALGPGRRRSSAATTSAPPSRSGRSAS